MYLTNKFNLLYLSYKFNTVRKNTWGL